MIRPSTFSIVAYDAIEAAWGIAVASKFPAAGAVVPWAQAGAGAVATQSHANTSYGPEGLAMMRAGTSAEETVDQLTKEDEEREVRQVGMVDALGNPATFTGTDCYEWAGGRTGPGYCVQGNILAGAQVVEAMASTFEAEAGDLPDRLLAALQAGDRAGGDRRGRQSAALLVVKEGAGYGGFNDRWLDYRVDDHQDPIPRLIELRELHRLYFGQSPPEERVQLTGDVFNRLQDLLINQAYLESSADATDGATFQRALRQFIGNENFEERADLDAGWIDKPVYEFLLRRFQE
ncbi:MAG: DUF1028 domain-containing protein [Anaerolineales bacterium]